MSHDELLDLIRLNLVPGIGPRLQAALLDRFGSASAALRASGSELLEVAGIGGKLSAAITQVRGSAAADREVERCDAAAITLIPRSAAGYPELLQQIHDPPPLLYCLGELHERDGLSIAIVGSRQCSLYGRQQAERLATALARAGMTVVSGLARGIDAAAHRGALAAGGRTIGVCATGLATLYPPEHAEFAGEIARSGAIVSESPLDRGPTPGIFPQRNRIISGLSLGVVIVEARRGSGALHTARHAMEQGRDVFAIPGRIDSLSSHGCHDLIRDGATLVRGPDDVLEALGPLLGPVQRSDGDTVYSPRELSLSEQERAVLNLVTSDPRHTDAILNATDLEPARVLATLTVLEMKRAVQRLPGGLVVRCW